MNRAEILTFGYRGRNRPKYGFYMHVYRPSMLKKKEPFIKYYKLQYIYRSCVSLFAYVHCLRCACGPMVVFSSFFFIFCASFLGVLLLLLRLLFVDGGISGLRGLFSFPMEK